MSACLITNLPTELVVRGLFYHLTGKDIERVHETNRSLRNMIKDPLNGRWLFDQHWNTEKLFHANSQLAYQWSTKDLVREGLYQAWYRDGSCNLESRELDGMWHVNGELQEQSAHRDGSQMRWSVDGQLESEFKNDVPVGACRLWVEHFFKDGQIDGLHQTWHRSGRIKAEVTYSGGKKEGPCRAWFLNGQKHTEYTNKNGKKDGAYKRWYTTGVLWVRCTYYDGKAYGPYFEFHSNEQMRISCTYEDGKRHGLHETWDRDGKLLGSTFYDKDSKVY